MANKIVSNTRIFLDCGKLLNLILDVTPSFPRAYKYTIGGKLHEITVELIADISAAYINRDRAIRINHLANFQARFETLKVLIRTAGDRHWTTLNKYAQLLELMDAIGKQSTAWKNSLIKARSEQMPESES